MPRKRWRLLRKQSAGVSFAQVQKMRAKRSLRERLATLSRAAAGVKPQISEVALRKPSAISDLERGPADAHSVDPDTLDVSNAARKPQVLGGYPWPSPLKRSAGWLLSLRLTSRAIAASWEPMRSPLSMPLPNAGKSWTA